MLKKLYKFFVLTLFLLLVSLNPSSVLADNDNFSSSYNVNYEINDEGLTSVTEGIVLKNLTDKLYASSFNLSISASNITDVEAKDGQGVMQVQVNQNDNKTVIDAKFNQQIVGKDKENAWALKFKSRDFAQKQGSIWQVTVPKISPGSDPDKFTLSLTVPTSFGDPVLIFPEPISNNEIGGKITYFFDKEQLTKSGIQAIFGSNQQYKYSLSYDLVNSGLLSKTFQVPIPSDGTFQKVLISSLDPLPDDVVIDKDGNYLAVYRLSFREKKHINIEGQAELFTKGQISPSIDEDKLAPFLTSDHYWEKDNPQIKGKLSEAFKNGKPERTTEKARLIYDYVVNALRFDSSRMQSKNYERLGALTTISNPEKALGFEFADYLITLLRAENIPARMLIGYAYSDNLGLRPLSLENKLHIWVEYYDANAGWLMVDPVWENTSGGVNYFSSFDLNHLVLLRRGVSSELPLYPSAASIEFSPNPLQAESKLSLSIDAPDQIYAGFPAKAKVKITNNGNISLFDTKINFSAKQLSVGGSGNDLKSQEINIPVLPPYGNVTEEFDLKTDSFWSSYDDILQLSATNSATSRKVLVKPFVSLQILSVGLITIIVVMVSTYFTLLYLHIRSKKKTKS